ncbi:hypothetical protein DSO57_1028138 [Entomophthora muscae]|uniref:Uncharacterized protein n=1 Tax=Entomophthora muscae TaxID=34485 RepID=A0ACC2TP25_9FUNG|nr:hypothetical protein DSO57_1028138 [Entomophthora muscae]
MIYTAKSHLTALEDQNIWLSNTTFNSCPKNFNQLWIIHAEVEKRVVPLIYCLMIGTKQENYVSALKIIKKEIPNIDLAKKYTKPVLAGRPPRDFIGLIGLKSLKKMKTFKELYKKHTSDTSGIAKKIVGRYPELCFIKKDEILKSVRLLDVDELNVANKELMVGFIDYFKDQWKESSLRRYMGQGRTR